MTAHPNLSPLPLTAHLTSLAVHYSREATSPMSHTLYISVCQAHRDGRQYAVDVDELDP